jgi:hypothetical protein
MIDLALLRNELKAIDEQELATEQTCIDHDHVRDENQGITLSQQSSSTNQTLSDQGPQKIVCAKRSGSWCGRQWGRYVVRKSH